ncbi:MAG: hypothetical protein KDI33_09230 [Halioglobus sp.]|nr:hypothetical protein [Halioglobus sp.]
MPRKTPTRILEARGAFRKNPQRKREDEPVVTEPLGSPPDGFKPDEVAAWREIVERAPLGVLTAADWQCVVLASKLFAEAMRDSESMNAARLSRLHSLLGDMGMTPSARASLSIAKPKEVNPFDQFR